MEARTGLFISTSLPDITKNVFTRVCQDFPGVEFTVVAPNRYRSLFPDQTSFFSNEEIKSNWWRLTRRLRSTRVDLAVVILDGRPVFRLPKLWAFLTNYRRLWVYDANGDRTLFHVSVNPLLLRQLWQEIRGGRRHSADFAQSQEELASRESHPGSVVLDDAYLAKVAGEREHYTDLHVDSETLLEPANPALTYLLDRFQRKVRERIGVDVWEHVVAAVNGRPGCQILSLGSGPCGTEINLAQRFTASYRFDCTDINPELLAKGKQKAESLGLHFRFICQDANFLVLPKHSYDIVFAHAALHHFVALEHIFKQVKRALKAGGEFILYEVIPRNGMLMWPETNHVVQRLWKLLPDRLKYEHPGNPPEFRAERPDRDTSVHGFECIRSQEIYPLLKKIFRTRIEVPGFAFARRFVDNDFGPNYDLSRPEDRALIDLILELDQLYLERGLLKPESIFMVVE
jgi:SAM-dependent methyltransferase